MGLLSWLPLGTPKDPRVNQLTTTAQANTGLAESILMTRTG